MEVLRSAVVSDLVGRLITFLASKYQERDTTESIVRMQRALLRARVVVEEAEGRQIANRAMLQQLNLLKREMCRATYALDTFRWRAVKLDRRSHASVSRLGLPQQHSSNYYGILPVVVKSLEGLLNDMREFVVLLGGCLRVTKQPYSAYLFMETCMFGRQMEKEEIISFLLQPAQDLDVLPIIGPHDVGKRTLVEHVCHDERVHKHFTKIHHLSSDELDDLQSPGSHWSVFDFTAAKSLMVINMVHNDADAEESWRRFHSAVGHHAHRGSKIIVISRTEAHSSLATFPALRLRAPCQEEVWYFFRTLAFGAANPDEHPDLAHLAMALCSSMSGLFTLFAVANIIAASLHADLSVDSWRRLFKVISETTVVQFGEDEYNYVCRPIKVAPSAFCMFRNGRKLKGVARSQLPKVTMVELLTGGSAPPAGEMRFDVLMWQSRIPPYGAYVATCDMEGARQLLIGEKRARKRRDQHENHQRRCI